MKQWSLLKNIQYQYIYNKKVKYKINEYLRVEKKQDQNTIVYYRYDLIIKTFFVNHYISSALDIEYIYVLCYNLIELFGN